MIGEHVTDSGTTIFQRIIGEYGDATSGHLLVVVAGLHGNEKGGLAAAERVLARLRDEQPRAAGRMVVIAGNLGALAAHERYLHTDLNRMWTTDAVTEAGQVRLDPRTPESHEQRELLDTINEKTRGDWDSMALIDLHSTSADAAPFCIIGDTLQNRRVAFALNIPVIVGLEEAIVGTIQEYFGERGFITIAVEGGHHDSPATADRLESALWLGLVATGVLEQRQVSEFARHTGHLVREAGSLPRVVEVTHRHGRMPEDMFEMVAGLENFSPIERGAVIANDRRGPIHAVDRGFLLLPSYQGLGDDGFFLGRQVNPFWLTLSAVVRRLRWYVLLPLLPGVSRHPADRRMLLANPRVARYGVQKVFHLFGYRKCPPQGGRLVFRQRPEHWLG